VVDIEDADVESEVKFWASSLIMYVLGGDLSMGAVKQFMIRHWNFVKLPDMFYNDEGCFILRFHSFKDKDDVLMQGPYTIRICQCCSVNGNLILASTETCCAPFPFGSSFLNFLYTSGVLKVSAKLEVLLVSLLSLMNALLINLGSHMLEC
jgi:hypothetical protein